MKSIKTLAYRKHQLSYSKRQIDILNSEKAGKIPLFSDKLVLQNLFPLKPLTIDTLQVNLGKMCNQTCAHCHVDAGPDRKEIMTIATINDCLKAIKNSNISTIDLTGGAPEMNPNFRYFVTEATKLNIKVIVRSNLTIIVSNKKYYDLPDFFKENNVEVVSSLPCYTEKTTDAQRGKGVFSASIKALKMLNAIGYGINGSNLKLSLVYNPTGVFLPGNQEDLEAQYKLNLKKDFDIYFNELFTITNMPISRFLDDLLQKDELASYMKLLLDNYNSHAAEDVMCRNILSVGWDGYLYDCDFNQMLDLNLDDNAHISNFDIDKFQNRQIKLNQHCYGCTAGAGSSCSGTITDA